MYRIDHVQLCGSDLSSWSQGGCNFFELRITIVMRLNTVECSVGIDNYDDTILIIMVLGGAVAGTHYRLNIRAGAPLHTQDIMQRAVIGVMRDQY